MAFRKPATLFMLSVSIILASSFTGFAYQNSDRPITSVSFTVSGEIPAGTRHDSLNLSISVPDGEDYYFSGTTVVDEGEYWDAGSAATIQVNLRAAADHYFKITKASQITLNGNKVKYVSAQRADGGYLLQVTVSLPVGTEAAPEVLSGGWEQDGDSWIYRYTDGSLATGWKEIDGDWYYFQSNYRMAANQWLEDGTYYVGADGRMLKNAHTPDGYWVDADGRYRSDASSSGYFSGYERKLDGEFADGSASYSIYYNSSYTDKNTGATIYIDGIEPSSRNHSFLLSYHMENAAENYPIDYNVTAVSRHIKKYENEKNIKKRNEKIKEAQRNKIYEYETSAKDFTLNLSPGETVAEMKTDLSGYTYTVYLGRWMQNQ